MRTPSYRLVMVVDMDAWSMDLEDQLDAVIDRIPDVSVFSKSVTEAPNHDWQDRVIRWDAASEDIASRAFNAICAFLGSCTYVDGARCDVYGWNDIYYRWDGPVMQMLQSSARGPGDVWGD